MQIKNVFIDYIHINFTTFYIGTLLVFLFCFFFCFVFFCFFLICSTKIGVRLIQRQIRYQCLSQYFKLYNSMQIKLLVFGGSNWNYLTVFK